MKHCSKGNMRILRKPQAKEDKKLFKLKGQNNDVKSFIILLFSFISRIYCFNKYSHYHKGYRLLINFSI